MPIDINAALQDHSPDQVVQGLLALPPETVGFDVKGALADGVSQNDILRHLGANLPPDDASSTPPTSAAAAGPTDESYGSTIKSSLNQLGSGLANTASVLALPKVAAALRAATPAAPGPGYVDPGAALKRDWNAGNYSSLPNDVGRLGVSGLSDMGAGLAAGAAGTGLATAAGAAAPAAAIAGMVGAGGYAASRYFGDNVQARQAANNEAPDAIPTTGDYLGGAAATLPMAAMSALGLKAPGLDKIANPVARAAAKVAAEGAASSGIDMAGQAARTAGTNQGLTIDPSEAAAAAIQGATARAATLSAAPIKAGLDAANTKLLQATVGAPTDPAEQVALVRMMDQIKSTQDGARGNISEQQAAGTALAQLRTRLDLEAKQLRDSGQITSGDYTSIMAPLINSASVHTQSLTDEGAGALSQFRQLPIDDSYKQGFEDDLNVADLLSQVARKNRTSGPAQKIMGAASNVVAPLLAAYEGSALGPAGSVAGLIGAISGHGPIKAMASNVGRTVDNALGLSRSDQVIRAQLAAKALGDTQTPPIPLQTTLDRLTSASNPGSAPARTAMGLPAEPPTGVNNPATGQPFENVIDAFRHANTTGDGAIYQDPKQDIAPYVITPDVAAQVQQRLNNPAALSGSATIQRLTQAATKSANEATKTLLGGNTLTPEQAFVLSQGRQGSPVQPSDPLVNPSVRPAPQPGPAAAPGSPSEAPSPVQATPTAGQAPQATQGAPEATQAAPPIGPPTGQRIANPQWLSWIRQHMAMNGIDPSVATHQGAIEAAQALADHGLVDRDVADKLPGYFGPIPANPTTPGDFMHTLAGEMARRAGRSDALMTVSDYGSPLARARAMAAVPDPNPIRSPEQYANVATQRQAYLANLAKNVESQGFPELANKVLEMSQPLTTAHKAQLAADFLKTLPRGRGAQADRYTLANTVLNDSTLRLGTDQNR